MDESEQRQYSLLADVEDLRQMLAELRSRGVDVDALTEKVDHLGAGLTEQAAGKTRGEPASFIEVVEDITERLGDERSAAIKNDLRAALGATSDLRQAMELVLDSALLMEGIDSGCAYVAGGKTGGFDLVAQRGLSDRLFRAMLSAGTDPKHGGRPGGVGDPRIISINYSDILGSPDPAYCGDGLHSLVVIPMWHDERPVAMLAVGSHELDEVPAGTRTALEDMATDAAGAIARVRAEHARTEAVEALQKVISNAPLAIYSLDGDAQITFWNEAATRMFGWTEEEVLGKRPPFIPEDRQWEYEENVRRGLREGGLRGVELERRRRDGSPIYVRLSTTLLFDEEGNIEWNLAMMEDITRRKRAEEDHKRLSRLESLGTLAGGIAHDFNNLLMGIMGNVSLARVEHDPEARDAVLAGVEGAAAKAVTLTRQLLTFAKGGAPEREVVSLRELLVDVAAFALSGSRAKLEFDIGDLWPVEVDPGQVSQVIQNLVINADESMEHGGHVVVRAHNFTDTDGTAFVRLSVSDIGSGIAPEIAERIFDPYFSTKETGSGLGLAVAHSIVTRHGGRITVEAHPGRGSTFEVLLPAEPGAVPKVVPGAAPGTTSEPAGARRPAGHHAARILVVDDEEMVRKILLRMLGHLGHTAVAASSGDEALATFRAAIAGDEPFGLVITDLTMPGGLGGVEMTAELLKVDPGVKVVVSSGYSEDPAVARYQDYGFAAAIKKPYTMESLKQVLSGVL